MRIRMSGGAVRVIREDDPYPIRRFVEYDSRLLILRVGPRNDIKDTGDRTFPNLPHIMYSQQTYTTFVVLALRVSELAGDGSVPSLLPNCRA